MSIRTPKTILIPTQDFRRNKIRCVFRCRSAILPQSRFSYQHIILVKP